MGRWSITRRTAFKWFLHKVVIQTDDYNREFTFSRSNRNKDYYLLTPELRNEYEKNVELKEFNRLDRPEITSCIAK